MARKFFSRWGGLPDFCALAAVAWCLSYGFTTGIVGAHVGRQSSTFAIGVFLPIIAAPLLGAMGLQVGRLAAFALVPFFPVRWIRVLMWSAPLVLVLIVIVAALQAGRPIYAAEREARPRVIQNTARIQRQTGNPITADVTPGSRVYDYLQKVNRTIAWGAQRAQLANRGDVLEVNFASSGASLRIPLPGIDYITHVDALPLRMGTAARPGLALLITGRATGRRDLIAVITESGELAYLELLERFWNDRSVSLAIAPSAAGDLILIGSEPQNLLVLALPDSA